MRIVGARRKKLRPRRDGRLLKIAASHRHHVSNQRQHRAVAPSARNGTIGFSPDSAHK